MEAVAVKIGLGAALGLADGLSSPLGSFPLLFFFEFKAL